jgi:hypothetical protein
MSENDIQAEPPDPRRRPPSAVREGDIEPAEVLPVEPARDFRSDGTDEAVQVVIPYRNPLALASYYCGVFSLIPCLALILGPTALVLGILGYRKRATDPRLHGAGHAIAGIILGLLTSLANYGLVGFGLVMAVKNSR